MWDVSLSNGEWINRRLRKLLEASAGIKNGGPTNEYGHHTAMKLVAIQYYAETFAKVVHKQVENKTADGAVFLDLFAGAGLVRLKGSLRGDLLPGSTCCAGQIQDGFNYLVGIEKNPDKHAALEERLAGIVGEKKFDVLQGDCNTVVNDAISLIQRRFKKPIVLAFVDPEGLQIKASTLQRISEAFGRCDFVINVNTGGLSRVVAKYKKEIHNVRKSLEKFMDSDIKELLGALENEPPQKAYYKNIVGGMLGKQVGSTIKIRKSRGVEAYYLLGYTRQTAGGAGYTKALKVLKERLEAFDGDVVRREMNKIQGGQKTLDGAGRDREAQAAPAPPADGQRTLDGC